MRADRRRRHGPPPPPGRAAPRLPAEVDLLHRSWRERPDRHPRRVPRHGRSRAAAGYLAPRRAASRRGACPRRPRSPSIIASGSGGASGCGRCQVARAFWIDGAQRVEPLARLRGDPGRPGVGRTEVGLGLHLEDRARSGARPATGPGASPGRASGSRTARWGRARTPRASRRARPRSRPPPPPGSARRLDRGRPGCRGPAGGRTRGRRDRPRGRGS